MSMNTHVEGIKPPDGDWRKMKTVWDACTQADVPIPQAVQEFFGFEDPDEKGVVVSLMGTPCLSEYNADMQDGFEVDLTKLPDDIKIIRFYNSY